MRPYSEFNRGHPYILIDVLSKYAWAVPLKNKGGSETAGAISEIVRKSGQCLKNSWTDRGKAFYKIYVQKILKKHDMIITVLRIRRWKRQWSSGLNTQEWYIEDVYAQLQLDRRAAASRIRLHYARKHRTIGMRPANVTLTIAERLLDTMYDAIKIAGKIQSKRCVRKYKMVFKKDYTPNWPSKGLQSLRCSVPIP